MNMRVDFLDDHTSRRILIITNNFLNMIKEKQFVNYKLHTEILLNTNQNNFFNTNDITKVKRYNICGRR